MVGSGTSPTEPRTSEVGQWVRPGLQGPSKGPPRIEPLPEGRDAYRTPVQRVRQVVPLGVGGWGAEPIGPRLSCPPGSVGRRRDGRFVSTPVPRFRIPDLFSPTETPSGDRDRLGPDGPEGTPTVF